MRSVHSRRALEIQRSQMASARRLDRRGDDAVGPLGLIHERVPGLLGCPGGGGVGSDAGEVDPATVMLDDEQHVKPAEKDGAGMEEGRPRRSSWPGRTGTASS
jgi:hypothetical protein